MASLDPTAISRPRTPNTLSGYRLEKLVGMGGMGEVHKAVQLSLGRTVAVKLLNADLAKDPAFVARFEKEAAALATLSHPNIVAIVDKGSTEATYYLVMEFVDGPSLRELMRSPLLTPQECLKMMLEICRGVDYAHKRGVIHRDLKPENILFDKQAGSIAKVTDFGLASFLEDANASARFALTSTHVSMGTLSYMAPEQRVDAKNADARADIFSLGVILYELLTGEVPLGTFDPPSKRKPGIDPRLDDIIGRCLKPDPAERYSSVAELSADLEPMVPATHSQAPKPLTRWQRVKWGMGRVVRFALQTAAVLVVLAALGVLAVAWLRSGEKRVPLMPGAALTGELGPPNVRTLNGRLAKGADRKVELEPEGPDPLSALISGRPVTSEGKALVFPVVEGQSRVGRAVVDVVDLEGDIAVLKAEVLADGPPPTPAVRARTLLYGPPPEPQVALMLVGSTGRYVALVQDGAGGPLALEWALGERRGTMLGQASPSGVVHLEMEVDALGVLRAFVGTGRDRRPIAEPLVIGPEWQKHFGEAAPRPAVGCIEGTCRVESFSYSIKNAPPPPPTTTVAGLTPAAPKPAPVPVKAVKPSAPPPKKPQGRPPQPPPKGGKRSK